MTEAVKKKRMKTSSAKSKGRRLCQKVKTMFHFFAPDLADGDITVTPSGVRGSDVVFSPRAKEKFNLVVECKNTEKIQIWAAIAQSKTHVKNGEIPITVFSKNNEEPYICLRLEDFLKLVS